MFASGRRLFQDLFGPRGRSYANKYRFKQQPIKTEPKVPESKVPESKVPEPKVPEPKVPEATAPEPNNPTASALSRTPFYKSDVFRKYSVVGSVMGSMIFMCNVPYLFIDRPAVVVDNSYSYYDYPYCAPEELFCVLVGKSVFYGACWPLLVARTMLASYVACRTGDVNYLRPPFVLGSREPKVGRCLGTGMDDKYSVV